MKTARMGKVNWNIITRLISGSTLAGMSVYSFIGYFLVRGFTVLQWICWNILLILSIYYLTTGIYKLVAKYRKG